ncbi:MAG: apolipoprotein N-acyltransferase [Actinomycetota bacterium]
MRSGARALLARLTVAAASGAVLVLAFPSTNEHWIGFAALTPLVLVLRSARRARYGALAGFVAGFTFFGILLAWISRFGFVAWGVLVTAEALAWAVFGALAARTSRFGPVMRLVGWPFLWAGIEMARARYPFGGFAWGGLGDTQIDGGGVIHLARWGGVFCVSAAVFAVNVLIAEVVAGGALSRRAVLVAIAAALVFAPVAIPLGLAGTRSGTVDLAAVQPDVPRERFTSIGHNGRIGPEDTIIVDSAASETATISASDPPQLVVWPENTLDRDPRTHPEVATPTRDAVRRLRVPFIVGAILDEGETRFRNSNLLLDPSGTIVGRYDKIHLVPFGEYVPWRWARRVVPALDRELPYDGVPGSRPVVFDVAGARVGTVICFESTYPGLVRTLVRRGAQLVVVTTNDASFGNSPAAEQHLQMSRMRAIESGRAVVHDAISGISAIVMPDGRVVESAARWERAVLRAELPLTDGQTPYTRFGSAIEFAIAAAAAVVAGAATVRVMVTAA